MKDCKTCIWYGKEKPGQCGNYLCRNQSEYDPRAGVEEADPTADVRPVVLCKDCVYSNKWYADRLICYLWNDHDGNAVFEDGFCNYGFKREES